MPYHPSTFCDRRRQVAAFFVSIGLAVSSLVVPWVASTANASTPVVTNYTGTGLSNPSGITAGPDGASWFTNSGNNSIGRITTGGVVTNYTGTGINIPEGITVGPDGALWFTNAGNSFGQTGSIGRITTGGVVTNFGTGLSNPSGITAGPDGALWFTNSGIPTLHSPGSIGRITTGGVVTSYTGPGISNPLRIAAGPDGALWFTNETNRSIGRITTGGVVTNYTGTGINIPIGITAGPDGALWFTNSGNNSIGRITTGSNPPPSTSVLIPSNGAALSGSTTLDASASNATSVKFQLFGGIYGFYGPILCTATPTYYGWLCSWNTTTVPNGSYLLSSLAFNSTGSAYSVGGVNITVNNPTPTTSVVIPLNGATQSGTAALLDASASANVTSVKYELTGGTLTDQVIATATPTYYGWLAQWNTTTVPNGTYTLQSVAAYSGGVTGTSPGVTVTVANPGLADLANSSFTATATGSRGSGCLIVYLNFDAVYPGSAAVGNVTLHIAGCVSDPYTYVGTFTITTGVGTLSGSAPGTVTEQIVGGDLQESYQINLSVTTATGSFSGTTGTLLFSAPLNGVDSVAVE
jgi:streptogramin lyase